ncbi:ABC transporter ATP-binding protein [Methanobacterium alkalithermotolerans]|uniref:ABC transporter ATP-binding protein n=1 Tax=Methanobacterium alkalithermotolerans TaxID=2731220 RepID=A0A8T8K749_9EURY|nr:ABC transporter ATP-binding protein [Methanobacterium alkalithermotolerans]QUH23355.1 ABC transporter ATP-binding protein [Methanobacterium alkalithermotolerans]
MIKISSLTKYFGKIRALDNLNLEIKKGELLGLIGPNGAGKTTAIRIISCILQPDEGQVMVGGYDVLKNPLEVKSMIGYLPEEPNLYERFRAYDLLKYFGELYGVPSTQLESRIEELLELVGMKSRAQHRINTFSKGLRQRIGIARALVHDPDIIIFDEPTMGLDPATSLAIRDFIESLKGDKTILLCTHYMDEADALCDRVAILNQGQILDMGSPEELKSKIHGDIILNVSLNDPSQVDLNDFKNMDMVEKFTLKEDKLTLSLQSRRDISRIIEVVGTNLKAVNTKEPTLEDVFIQNVANLNK